MTKIQTLTPLETIYEESGSFVSSTNSIRYQDVNETINGLISARSIPTVNIQRQRAYENNVKPPVEVQFRDGSKRFIHSSTATAPMLINRRNLLDSSHDYLSTNTNFPKKNIHMKPLVLTIITADDLKQAGLTSPVSTPSDASNASSRTNTPMENHHHHHIIKKSPIPHRNSTPIQSNQLFLNRTISPHFTTSSYSVPLTNDENERKFSLNSTLTSKTMNSSTTENIRSAFRPFLKSVRFNQDTFTPQTHFLSTNNLRKTTNSTQQEQVIPYIQQQQHSTFQPSSTKFTNPTTFQPQIKSVNDSSTLTHLLNLPTNNEQTISFTVNPNIQWFNLASNSIYDIPHLSSKYSHIPLRITLPIVKPKHNQISLIKHNISLENRLLNAGLSPETVALYERILDVADTRQMKIKPLPNLINQYPYKSFV